MHFAARKIAIFVVMPAILMGSIASCSDFFDATGDDKTIVEDKFFSDETAFLQALTNVYTQLRGEHLYGNTLTLGIMEFAGGTLEPYDDETRAAADMLFSDARLQSRLDSMRMHAYRVVGACNKIIEKAEDTDVVFFNKGIREVVLGECYALRAAVQFDLLRIYHPLPADDMNYAMLPYITRYAQKDTPALTTKALLSAINSDLDKGDSLLSKYDPIMQSTNQTTVHIGELDRRLRTFQLNAYAVKAIKARVAMWEGDYQRAFDNATAVMKHFSSDDPALQRYNLFYYVTPGKFGSDFCFSRENIFALASLPTGFAALSNDMFAEKKIRCTTKMKEVYQQTADIRYRAWFREQEDGTYIMSNKYGPATLLSGYVANATGGNTDLPAAIPYIRLGEVTLIAAEAQLRMGNKAEAKQWLTLMETNKDVTYAADAADEKDLMKVIIDEYYRDLYGDGQLVFLKKRSHGM